MGCLQVETIELIGMIDKKLRRIAKKETEKYNVKEVVINKIMNGYIFVLCESEMREIFSKLKDVDSHELVINGHQIVLQGKRGKKVYIIFLKKEERLKEILCKAGEGKDDPIFIKGDVMSDIVFNDMIGMIFDKDVITDGISLSYMVIESKSKVEGKKLRKKLSKAIGDMFPTGVSMLKQFENMHDKEEMKAALLMGLMGLMDVGLKDK